METDDVIVIGEMPGQEAPSDAVTIDDASENPLPKHAVQNDDGTISLPLKYPVVLKWKKPGAAAPTEDSYASLLMHRLVGRDMMTLGGAAKDELGMLSIALSAKLPRHVFKHVYERMDGSDIAAASQVVSHFLGSGPATGR